MSLITRLFNAASSEFHKKASLNKLQIHRDFKIGVQSPPKGVAVEL
jgi:hypothetical protein